MKACTMWVVTVLFLALTGSSWGVAVIDEPFADSDPSLAGNVPGMGLTNTWSATSTFLVQSGSLAYGALPTSSNQVTYGDDGTTGFGNSAGTCEIDGSLAAAGLLDDGTNLWFSMLVDTPTQGGVNPDTGFALGTDELGSGNNIPMPSGGQGIGWSIKRDRLQATTWDSAVSRGNQTGPSVSGNTTILIVGEIIWGADAASNDIINLYLPGTDLLLPGAPADSRTGVLSQTNFVRITTALKTNSGYGFDEIRFGATYADVVPVPADVPAITSLSPTNGADNVSKSTDLVATFNKPVRFTGAGSVTITNMTLSTAEVISLPDSRVSLEADAALVIDPSVNLENSTHYAVLISGDAIEDFDSQAFAGIDDPSVWGFTTTADATPPTIIGTDPEDGTNGGVGTDLVATFDEDMQFTGAGTITLRNVTLGADATVYTLPDALVSISGSVLTIAPAARRETNTTYAVQISSDALEDLGGNAFPGIADETTWDFTTLATKNYAWTGAVSGDWNERGNWSANGVPIDVEPGGDLELSASEGEKIVFDAPLATNPVPTVNIPVLGGSAVLNPREYITPAIDISAGALAFSAVGFNNQGLVHDNAGTWTTTVGDGNMGNGTASLAYTGAFSQGLNRDPGDAMTWIVNADGALTIESTGASLVLSYDPTRPAVFILNGGSVTVPDPLDLLRNSTDPGPSYVEFNDAAGTFTAMFGDDFADVNAVNAACGDGLTFRSTLGVDPAAKDNGDGTFTVSVTVLEGMILFVR